GMRVKILDLMNLFEVETYLPATLELRVQPKAVPRPTRPIPVTLKNLEEKKGGHLLPVVGLGSDLRELRDFTPGTPFKQIDWKASARMRKLIAREYESELTVSTHFLLDIGPTMRWGSVGRRKLDYVQAITLSLLRLMSSNQDQVGLCFFDSQLFSYYPAQSGSRHFARLIEALLELNNVAHEDLTEGTRAELVARIGDFLFWQERIDLRLGGDGFEAVTRTFDDGLGLFESERVIEHVQQVLEHEKSLRAKRLYGKTRIASDPIDAELRLFCQIKGIELPLRFDTARDQKNRGLHEALERIYLRARTPQLIVILTDAHGLEITDQLRRTTQLLRKRHHHLALLLPFDPHFESRSRVDDATEQHLASLHRIEERQRGQVLRQELGRLGISLIHCTPDQALQTILDKLKRFRQAV
ncbi:MAG: DUF58 domain-containing protein, partial [Myxococcales bacterium]|nr:DUF58 domain-containing protein [Myxococcales bacterium]